MIRWGAWVAVGSLVAGCNGALAGAPTDDAGPAESGGSLDSGSSNTDGGLGMFVEPGELLSDISFTPLSVTTRDGVASIALLQAIASATSLRTYPELQVVPMTTSIAPPKVHVEPSTPLDPTRWYILAVDPTPAGVRPPQVGVTLDGHTTYASRFFVGSSPVIRRVEAMDTGIVDIKFSEGVSIDPNTLASFLSLRNADASACTYVPDGLPSAPPYRTSVRFACATAAATTPLTLTLTPGLQGGSGLPLGWLDGTAKTQGTLIITSGTFKLTANMEPCGKGCTAWRP